MLRSHKLYPTLRFLLFYRTTGFFCLSLNGLIFGYLLAADPGLFDVLMMEDSLAEWLSAVWLLLAGLALLTTARRERNVRLRWVWVLGGAALLFSAGEEISWGQRILGVATPEFLLGVNDQQELNVHNINLVGYVLHTLYQKGTHLLCIVTGAAHFLRKERLFGIPLPSIWLVPGLLVMVSHRPLGGYTDFPGFIVSDEKGLLLLLLVYALLAGNRRLFIVTAAGATVILAIAYTNFRVPSDPRSINELREYLFGIGCLFWSLEILQARGDLRAASSGRKLPGRRSLNRLRAGALALMVGSLGLVPFAAYFYGRV